MLVHGVRVGGKRPAEGAYRIAPAVGIGMGYSERGSERGQDRTGWAAEGKSKRGAEAGASYSLQYRPLATVTVPYGTAQGGQGRIGQGGKPTEPTTYSTAQHSTVRAVQCSAAQRSAGAGRAKGFGNTTRLLLVCCVLEERGAVGWE